MRNIAQKLQVITSCRIITPARGFAATKNMNRFRRNKFGSKLGFVRRLERNASKLVVQPKIRHITDKL